MEKGVPIRVITRTLKVLRAINQGRSLTMMEIARICDLAYPTTCRIVQSLVHEGYMEMEPQRKAYRPTGLVQSLSYGYQEENAFAAAARPAIVKLTQKIGWPSAISTRVAESMVIRDSTHSLTTMTFSEYYPGYAMPIWSSASGKVHLAFCKKEERRNIVESTRLKFLARDDEEFGDVDLANFDDDYIDYLVSSVREAGYAEMTRNQHSMNPGKTSSVSVPLMRDGEYVASLAVIFFSSAMTPSQAADKYLDDMLRAQDEIATLTAQNDENRTEN
ncbi:MAG: helix-turn-helix domain-containing protein [Pseudomonadota bacterium]